MKSVFYEWVVETTNPETENIEDTYPSDTIPTKPLQENEALVLVCDDTKGSMGCRRAWAYVENGILPNVFSDSEGNTVRFVPLKFRNEFSKSIHAAK